MVRMTSRRLPSFNDFSPEILKSDLRICLAAIRDCDGDDAKVVDAWAKEFFGGAANKRSQANIPATLRSTGLSTGTRPLALSSFGTAVLAAPSAKNASQIFCAEMIRKHNGDLLLKAMAALRRRNEVITKESLKAELKREGVEALSTNTTDHTTLKNWFVNAGIIDLQGVPNDALLKELLGISTAEMDEWSGLSLPQQIFLQHLRREHIAEDGPFPARDLLRPCMEMYPDLFDQAQFAKQIQKPLVAADWIVVTGLASGTHGGKSGRIRGALKLLDIPVERVIPDFDSAVPSDLRARIDTPLAEIRKNLLSSDTHLGGLALELLSLRMVIDLGLDPRHFRLRSSQTAHAEVDLLAEGSHLMFSRWTFQCKRYGKNSTTKVGLSEVAKEVGIALFVKAHVVVMVTTTSFTADARRYADVISEATALQFLFIDGNVVDAYLKNGKAALLDHARKNATAVMMQKRSRPVVASLPES